MKKINSANLWEFVNNLVTNQKVKFKVFYDDNYITEILWNGYYFEWEEGTFTSEGFFNPLYEFIVIEDDDKLERMKHFDLFDFFTGYDYGGTNKSLLKDLEMNFQNINNELAYLIDHINKLEEEMRK